jgi:hypothetical protein
MKLLNIFLVGLKEKPQETAQPEQYPKIEFCP